MTGVDSALALLPAVAILRASTSQYLLPAAEILIDAGFHALEFPLTTPGAAEAVSAARNYADDRAVVGAGTVLETADASASLDAGAQFLVCPGLCPDVIAAGRVAKVPVWSGVFTVSEIIAAR